MLALFGKIDLLERNQIRFRSSPGERLRDHETIADARPQVVWAIRMPVDIYSGSHWRHKCVWPRSGTNARFERNDATDERY